MQNLLFNSFSNQHVTTSANVIYHLHGVVKDVENLMLINPTQKVSFSLAPLKTSTKQDNVLFFSIFICFLSNLNIFCEFGDNSPSSFRSNKVSSKGGNLYFLVKLVLIVKQASHYEPKYFMNPYERYIICCRKTETSTLFLNKLSSALIFLLFIPKKACLFVVSLIACFHRFSKLFRCSFSSLRTEISSNLGRLNSLLTTVRYNDTLRI